MRTEEKQQSYAEILSLLGVESIEFVINWGDRERFSRRADKAQSLMKLYWQEGNQAFLEFLEGEDVRAAFIAGIDDANGDPQLSIRQISDLLGGKDKGVIRFARLGLNVGEEVEAEKEGVRRYTREELLRVAVGAFAYSIAIKKLGFEHPISDFRHKNNPRF